MTDIDYNRLILVIGLSINYVCVIVWEHLHSDPMYHPETTLKQHSSRFMSEFVFRDSDMERFSVYEGDSQINTPLPPHPLQGHVLGSGVDL